MCNQNQENIYEQYIEHLRCKQGFYPQGIMLDRHRVFPGFKGGTYEDPHNVLYITIREHTLAHFYRYISYGEVNDLRGYSMLSTQTEEGRREMLSLAGRIGGKARSELMGKAGEMFFDPEWQREYGLKGARKGGQKNVDSGHLAAMNKRITESMPEQRSEAGKKGAQARLDKQRREKTNLFSDNKYMQRKGNLVRWGYKNERGERIPYSELSQELIDKILGPAPEKTKTDPEKKKKPKRKTKSEPKKGE